MAHPYLRPRLRQAMPSGVIAYEKLRHEWIDANPEHSELELLKACAGFAKACGLTLRENVLQSQLQSLEGAAHVGN